jgi:hypothetical protein
MNDAETNCVFHKKIMIKNIKSKANNSAASDSWGSVGGSVRPCGLVGGATTSEENTVSIFYPEAGVCKFLLNGCKSLTSASSMRPDMIDPQYTFVGEVAASAGVLRFFMSECSPLSSETLPSSTAV